MNRNLSLLPLVLLFLTGCNYDTNEHFVNPIAPPDPERAVITLGANNDTVTLVQDAILEFTLTTTYHHVETEIWFNHTKLMTLSGGITSFPISISNYRPGYYPLALKIITRPTTGSLADIEGSELMSSWELFTVLVDKSTPERPAFTTIGAEDGTLRIRWQKSPDPAFEFYELKKYTFNSSFETYEVRDTIIVTDPDQTFADDPAFIGGSAVYRLRIFAKGRFSEAIEQNYVSPWTADFTYTWQDNANARFSWRKNPYYNNILRVEFSRQSTPWEAITDKDDTIRTHHAPDFRFGASTTFVLRFVPKIRPQVPMTFSTLMFKGSACHPNFYFSAYVKPRDEYFAIKHSGDWRVNDSLFVFGQDKLNPIRVHTLEKNAWQMQFDEAGTILYLLYEDELVAYDPVTLSQIKRYPFSALPSGYHNVESSNMTVTENGLALLNFWDDAVIDLEEMKIVFTTDDPILAISPDGSQIFVRYDRYVFDGNTYVKTDPAFFSSGLSLHEVTHPSNDTLAVAEAERFRIYDAQSGVIEKQVDIGDGYSRYDHHNGLLYVFGDQELMVVNLQNDQQQSIPSDFSNGVNITNKFLVCRKGFYMRVD